MKEETMYSKVPDAEKMMEDLCKKYPDVLWAVTPSKVSVLAIENKERSKKNKTLAKIKPVKGAEKALLRLNNIDKTFIILLYWADWNEWSSKQKQWILFHELLHISFEEGKTIDHDCKDFRIILDVAGVEWFMSQKLPNLLEDSVKFDLNLRPNLDEDGKAEKKEGDEIPEPKTKKSKKAKEEPEEDPFEESKDDKEDDDVHDEGGHDDEDEEDDK